MAAILYEFAGCDPEVEVKDVEARILRGGAESGDVDFYIDLLCDVGFLSIETSTGFRYATNEPERESLRRVARNIATNSDKGNERYKINAAFYYVLQIENGLVQTDGNP